MRSSLHREALPFVPNTLTEPSGVDSSTQSVQTTVYSGTSCLNTVTEVQLSAKIVLIFFWTDSKVVLGYIANKTKLFHLLVANRVGFIHSRSDKGKWIYVPGSQNLAYIASIGSSAKHLQSLGGSYGSSVSSKVRISTYLKMRR